MTTIRVGSCMVHTGRKSSGNVTKMFRHLVVDFESEYGSDSVSCLVSSCLVLYNTSEFNVGSSARNERAKGSHQAVYPHQRRRDKAVSCSTNNDSGRRQC